MQCTTLLFLRLRWLYGSFVSLRRASIDGRTHVHTNSTKQHSKRVRSERHPWHCRRSSYGSQLSHPPLPLLPLPLPPSFPPIPASKRGREGGGEKRRVVEDGGKGGGGNGGVYVCCLFVGDVRVGTKGGRDGGTERAKERETCFKHRFLRARKKGISSEVRSHRHLLLLVHLLLLPLFPCPPFLPPSHPALSLKKEGRREEGGNLGGNTRHRLDTKCGRGLTNTDHGNQPRATRGPPKR